MKNALNYLIAILFFLTGCHNQQDITANKILNEAASLIEVNPDSALCTLNVILAPDSLNERNFSRWCMLSGKIADKIYTPLPAPFYMEKANRWFSKYGTAEDKAQVMLYLGRSYAEEGDKDKAMTTYTNTLDITEKHKLYNLAGHTNSYIAALYESKSMYSIAINKYKIAADLFKSIDKTDSYICALRDIGRGYALMDSLNAAESIMLLADSLATHLSKDDELKSSINNSLGNIYSLQEEYGKAIQYLKRAIRQDNKSIPNNAALIQAYINSDSIHKAYELLKKLPLDTSKYTYTIKDLYYQINKVQKDYKQALENLEECSLILDSVIYAETQSQILTIESKYNYLKTQKENEKLKSTQQRHILILTVSVLLLIITSISYQLYKKKAKEKNQEKEIELNHAQIKILHLASELEKKKAILIETQKEKNEYKALEAEVATLSANYQKLQRKMLTDSDLYKELARLANSKTPKNDKTIITDKLWERITHEITFIYPTFYTYVYSLCPNLSEQEWRYCCLYMFAFDSNEEAKLLNIMPDSVKTKHSRLRQKLNITLPPKSSLYEHFINNIG
ncbi:tetratricopeptide repeat protein [Bacteroides sp. GD17]|jgi:hypothetical protein|uniref:tetratricopeptide repeat protein n=1 Tax=Bacteroides sp. GD17 TaxID=3139826 RepID=UPI0025DD7963|nr:tetratricopeptide repeat protein [uncultured Bacteroides sp.]